MNLKIEVGKKYKMGFGGKVVKIISKTDDVGYGQLPWDDYLFRGDDDNLFRENGEAMHRDGGHLSEHCLDICNLVNM